MKKICSFMLSFCLLMGLMFFPNIEAKASSVSLGVSSSSINIGDTVTVSVSVPDGITAGVDLSFSSDVLSFVSASTDVGVNGGTVTINLGKYSMVGTNTVSVTFKATTSGTASISASPTSAVDIDANEITLSGASTSITVANQAADTPANPVDPEGPADTPLSADNSLSSLKLSSGTLSPSFQYSVTNYTATVGYNVTSVVVSATTSNEKATIESVTGNGTVSLSVGENVIEIVVKAENGVKATYKVTVTRLEEGTTTEPTDTESETTETETATDTPLEWNGQVLQPAENIPNEVVPADFEKTTVVLNNVEIPCLTFANGDLKVLYLTNEEGTATLFVYDDVQQTVYPFVKIASEDRYVIVLLPDEENAPAPEAYSACTLSIEGKGVINAYQFVQSAETTEATDLTGWFAPEVFYAAEPVATDFYLIYCMNNTGEKGWYVYDSVEGTIQRFLGSVHTPAGATSGAANSTDETTDLDKLTADLANAKKLQLLTICVSAFVIIVLIVVIVNLVLRNRSDEDDEYYDDDEEDDEYFDDDHDFEEDTDAIDDVEDLDVEELDAEEAEEDDEIEVEFYEMTEESVSGEVVTEDAEDEEIEIEFYEIIEDDEDDEVEVEFYNMEDLLVNEVITTEDIPKNEVPVEKASVSSSAVSVSNTYTDDDDDDDLEFIELD